MQPESDHPHHRPLLALGLRLAAAFVLAALLACVKLASDKGIHLAEIMFWRQLPTIPILFAWFALRGRLDVLATRRTGSHLRRSGFGLVGMAMNFGAATLLPLAVATTLNYSSAIFAVLLSALILREPTGVWRWSAVAMGFAGVVLIAQPWSGELPLLGAAIALGAALMIALISVQLRDLGRTEHPFTIVFYFSLFSVPVLALAMPIVGKAHAPEEWLLLLACGVIGLLGQVLLTAALRYGAVANVIVMDYSGLIWATLFGWLVFTSLPPASFWFGAPLVVGAGLLIAWREHRLGLARRALMEPKEA
ncbi:DMT family transporter [Qipengyuania profunda]|jgi:drug/metabolite transporter (DMT)-like permease|uniref:DMT family transporter n=1 Tax=Qipengyuania profunda TaxID=3113984 RepID=UPI002A188B6E|nr:DMT family transporter [Qipengyuania sp. HL-TH1]WPL56436.1 DMT family transporter [Qipengyuania sp. HL-TH5]